MSLYKEYKDVVHKYKTFLRDNTHGILMDALKEIKELGTISKFISYGYTPYYNDGEACKHTPSTALTLSHMGELAECYNDSETLREFLGVPEDIKTTKWAYNKENEFNVLTQEQRSEIYKITSDIEDILYKIYGTNYIIFFDLSFDEPSIMVEEYASRY